MFVKGFFCGLCDFDGDGKLNAFERTMDFMLFNELINEDKYEDVDADNDDSDF